MDTNGKTTSTPTPAAYAAADHIAITMPAAFWRALADGLRAHNGIHPAAQLQLHRHGWMAVASIEGAIADHSDVERPRA